MKKAAKEIVQEDSAILRQVALPVPESLFGTAELTTLIEDMSVALDGQLEGVALAAPQIGVSLRIFIVRTDRTSPPEATDEATEPGAKIDVYINPEITKTSRKRGETEEGCLSVKGVYGTTRPHERVTLRAQRVDGTRFERGAGGLLAQIFEHEVNHLNGILFIDHAEHLIHIPHDDNG
ncbi:MAG: peptide deformylase [Candidatus Paceibacterota bacterium]